MSNCRLLYKDIEMLYECGCCEMEHVDNSVIDEDGNVIGVFKCRRCGCVTYGASVGGYCQSCGAKISFIHYDDAKLTEKLLELSNRDELFTAADLLQAIGIDGIIEDKSCSVMYDSMSILKLASMVEEEASEERNAEYSKIIRVRQIAQKMHDDAIALGDDYGVASDVIRTRADMILDAIDDNSDRVSG